MCALTGYSGRLFHFGIACGTNAYFSKSVLGLYLVNFLRWSCLVLVELNSKNSSGGSATYLLSILKTIVHQQMVHQSF